MKTLREVFFLGFLALGGCAGAAGAVDATTGKPANPGAAGYAGGLNEILYMVAYAAARELVPRLYGAVKKKEPA